MRLALLFALAPLFFVPLSFAAPVDQDLKLAYQNVSILNQLNDEFEQLIPLFQKLERDQRLPHQEAFEIKKLWGRVFDMQVVLNALLQTYEDYELKSAKDNAKAMLVKRSATLGILNSGARISKLIWKMPKTRQLLNELHRDYPIGTVVSMENQIFKMHHTLPLHGELPSFFPAVDIEEQAARFHQLMPIVFEEEIESALYKLVEKEEQTFKTFSRPFLASLRNNLRVYARYQRFNFKTLFSQAVTKISSWLGDTKVKRRSEDYYNGKTYIDLELAQAFEEKLEPGDIMISRTNWFLSNAFLPGFWPHSFIYIGNATKLKSLNDDTEISGHYRKKCQALQLDCDNFTTFLATHSKTAEAFANYQEPASDGHEKVLVEATSDGVHFSSIRHTFLNDFLAAMRPQITSLQKAQAIEESMTFLGMPYDFDFDFDTHSSLVCSELVAKSFTSKVEFDYDRQRGLYVEEYLGRYSLPVIGIVKKMVDENVNYLRNSQLEFVGFLKGIPEQNTAILATEEEFYQTPEWPKWSFMQ